MLKSGRKVTSNPSSQHFGQLLIDLLGVNSDHRGHLSGALSQGGMHFNDAPPYPDWHRFIYRNYRKPRGKTKISKPITCCSNTPSDNSWKRLGNALETPGTPPGTPPGHLLDTSVEARTSTEVPLGIKPPLPMVVLLGCEMAMVENHFSILRPGEDKLL